MKMRSILLVTAGVVSAGLCLSVGLHWGATAWGENPQPAKLSPVKALQTAIKNLGKAESYRATVSIEGGISDQVDHSVTELTVREAYEGDVFGSLMYVPKPNKAYRYPKRGVAYVDGAWKNILADMRTTRLDRLFSFPEVILGRAVTHAPASGRWLTPQEEKAKGYEGDDEEDSADSDEDDPDEADSDEGASSDEGSPAKGKAKPEVSKKAPTGKTVAVKPKSAAPEGPPSRVMHIEAPPKEALTHFTEVQNSGCMSGG